MQKITINRQQIHGSLDTDPVSESGIRYPAESGWALSGNIRYPISGKICYPVHPYSFPSVRETNWKPTCTHSAIEDYELYATAGCIKVYLVSTIEVIDECWNY